VAGDFSPLINPGSEKVFDFPQGICYPIQCYAIDRIAAAVKS
jgi:hypothetical protein